MIYGRFSEGRRRECANCGTVTSSFSYCWTCDMVICDGCDHTCVPVEEVTMDDHDLKAALGRIIDDFREGRRNDYETEFRVCWTCGTVVEVGRQHICTKESN